MEIERKFLCNKPDFDIAGFNKTDIIQYYVSTEPVIRIRKTDTAFYLTVKSKGSVSRQELEMEISEKEFDNLVKLTDKPPVSKTRYFIPLENSLTAELDIYNGSLSGLFTVEVEFESLDDAEKFTPPEWFGKDVSEDNRYKNSALYIKGLPE